MSSRRRIARVSLPTLLAAFLVLTLVPGESRGQCTTCNPATGLPKVVCCSDMAIDPGCPVGHTDQTNWPAVVIGSPSGLADPRGTFDMYFAKSSVDAWMPDGTLIWLLEQGSSPGPFGPPNFYSGPLDNDVICSSSDFTTAGPYQIQSTVTGEVSFNPRFGGHSLLTVAFQLDPSCFAAGYAQITGHLAARSTDIDDDGDTDQDDKLSIGRAILSAIQTGVPADVATYDLDANGIVDGADYVVVAKEAALEVARGIPSQAFCDSYKTTGTRTADTSPPGAVTIARTRSGCDNYLNWTAPGDDTDNGNQLGVAKSYDLRFSSALITTSNFSSATPFTGMTAPQLAGSAESVDIGAYDPSMKYWALITTDWAGNQSAMSNVVTITSGCVNAMEPARPDEGAATSYEMALKPVAPNPVHDSAVIRFVVPTSAGGRSVDVAVFDGSGRRVASLARGDFDAGEHEVAWNLSDESGHPAASGVYFVRFIAAGQQLSRTILVMR